MANSDPYKARLAKARKRIKTLTAGDILLAQKALNTIILDGLSRIELSPGDREYCRLAMAITSAAREYRALIEVGEIERRIEEMEVQHKQSNSTGLHHRRNFA